MYGILFCKTKGYDTYFMSMRKLPDANDLTAIVFENFYAKNFIFFDFLQIVLEAIMLVKRKEKILFFTEN